ncbi:MAG: N-6 DNA methylase [Holophagales bacterium]|jgi:predicted helicase|nr:N-6 DNA methylase [Holophagales bacterium]
MAASAQSSHGHQEAIQAYIGELGAQRRTPKPTEHSYRPALARLLKELLPHLNPSNEQGRTECGAPDFVLLRQKDNVPVAYVEAKDMGDSDLEGRKGNKEQFDRYKGALDSIIFTDYLDFIFCKDGQIIDRVRIAEEKDKKIIPAKGQFVKFLGLMAAFGDASPQAIASPAKLAQIMANKARLMAKVFEGSVATESGDGSLMGQMEAFRSYLIHDITPKEFADLYAQTITYGMFAARIHASSTDAFSRRSSAELIPKTNPFLRNLFHTIAGLDLREGISWIVDDLAEAFKATDIEAVLSGIGRSMHQADPLIHFYEDFLSAYDPALRKSRGVWYTPKPIVQFIVRAVDHVLRTDFNLPKGLADNSKIRIRTQNAESEVHKVQILDPATGTGTFLAETVGQIFEKFQGQAGAWQSYVEQHLIPRINGFEILMAPYAMAHLKLDWMLAETGYVHKGGQRLRIYLTNSLEEHHPDTGTLFAQFLANEAREANAVKKDAPVMVIMGNPPYSISSSNKGKWIDDLIGDYKSGLGERNIQPLSDDYIKFIRYGQHLIEKNGEGVLAYISNNSFIDGIIHRQMRKRLLEFFDKIYILDLHGNTRRKEASPDGGKDENVFDIQQGVSVNIFIKTRAVAKQKRADAKVFHCDLFGKREEKYSFLRDAALDGVQWSEIVFKDESYLFVPKNFELWNEYEKGFRIDELFPINANGIKTQRDDASITLTQEKCDIIKNDFLTLSNHELSQKYGFIDVRDWTIDESRNDLQQNNIIASRLHYRPFDFRFMNYTGKTMGIMGYPRYSLMKHFIVGQNIGLIISRQAITDNWSHVQLTKEIIDNRIHYSNKGIPIVCPLYLYSDHADSPREPNLDLEIVKKISKGIGLDFEYEKSGETFKFAPIDLLDYIYAVLHSADYRKKYNEALKNDFPHVPYPDDTLEFRRLASLGAELRGLHLLEHPGLNKVLHEYSFPAIGDNAVEKLRWQPHSPDNGLGRVWINEKQYFDKVPLASWVFYIGGYQPAQKWLKDRKGRTLTFEDIEHYQKMIKALAMTKEIMGKIG